MDANDTTPLKSNGATYVFAIYWVFETLTTVGYGDYYGSTSDEYLVTIVFEFVGFCYNAVLITIMSNAFAQETSFQDLLTARLAEADIWMKKIQ